MKNKIIIALIAVVMVVCSLTLVACSNKDADIITNYIFEQEGQIVESDFVLPLTISEKKAEWTSNSQYVTLTKREENWLASVSYPEKDIEDVTLTLTIGSASKDFVVRVKAIDEITFMDNYVFKQDKGTVAANFALDRTYEFKGKTCNISWSVDQAYELYIKISDDGNQCLVFEQSESTPVVIKATFEYQGNTATKSYSMNVYQQLEGLELVDFWYSNTGVSIEMSGYVVLIGTEYSSSYNNVTLYMVNDDYTAGYYLYRVKTTDEHAANLKKGAHVTVTGTTNTNYNGLIETNAGGNLVVDAAWEIPFEEDKAIKVVDDLVIGNLPATIYNESRLVSLTNWKVKSHGAESDLSSDNLTLMTITKGGVSVDIRISKYLEGAYTKGDDTHKALLALLDTYPVDSTLNVQGIFSNYGGAWQIMPLSVDDVTAGGEADADDKKDYDGLKVADAVKAVNAKIAELGLNQRITSNLECELLSSSNGVNISYYIRKSNSAVLDGAKLTVTPGNPETTALQVKYSINDFETVQYIYISSLIPTAASMIEEIKLPDSIIGEVDLPTIEGAEIVWEILTGDTNSLTIDAENNKLVPVLGDKAITYIISAKLTYNGQERTKKFVIVLKSLSDLADHAGTEEDPYTIADVNKIASNLSTSATKENFYIQAYIKELGSWSEQYGNYNSGYLGDSVSDENALYAYILKGIDKGTLNVGDKVICSVGSLLYYSNSSIWEIKNVQVTKIVSSASAAEPEGRKVILSNEGKYITSELYVYTSSSGSTKDELVLSSDASKAQAIIIVENEDKSVSLITPDWKYLYCNGTNVNFADEAGDYTLFNLVEVEGGYNIVSVNAKYNENAQYLQVYNGYLTCYSYEENNASRYLIGIQDYADVEPEPEPAGPEFEHAGTEADPYTIADVNKMFDAEYTDAKNFYLDAYIVEVSGWSDQYGNYSYAKLAASADDDNKVSVYIFKGDDIANAKVGDHVICTVEYISKYNENWQICKVAIVKYVEDGSEVNPDQPADVTVSFTMESIAKANSWENSKLYESFEKDGISFKATGTPLGTYGLNTGKYYTKGLNWRIYQNENPSLTITAPKGKKIVSVAINYAVNNTGVLLNGETQVASDEVVSVNAKSIVFGVGATDSSKTNGQVQVVSVIVVLGEIDGTEIEVPVHTHTYGDLVSAKDPTCGEAGNVAYYHCEECNKYFDEDKNEIESVEIAPTYYHSDENEDGMCDDCNYQFHELYGAYINIAIQSKYLTSETYEYTNSKGSTKLEIVVSENAEDAAIFWVYDNGDGTLSLIATDLETHDMSYLYCNGNDVKYVSLLDMDDNDIYNRFVLEEVEGGYNIKTSAVSYSKVQYLEIYEGYVTCYGLGSDASAFTFSITELNLGGDDDEGDDQDQNSIKYANDDVTITIKSDDEYSLTVDYSAENGNLWAEEYDLSLDETDDGYSFACGVGNAKRDVILVISDDEKTLTLTDSYLNLTNVELTLNYTPSKEDDDQGEAATFTADQQGTYNIVGGSVYGDAVVMIFEESVSVTWTQQGVDVKNAKASLLENGYKVILDAQYGDYLQFSFEGNEMKYYITYNYSTLQGNVSKSTSTEVEE